MKSHSATWFGGRGERSTEEFAVRPDGVLGDKGLSCRSAAGGNGVGGVRGRATDNFKGGSLALRSVFSREEPCSSLEVESVVVYGDTDCAATPGTRTEQWGVLVEKCGIKGLKVAGENDACLLPRSCAGLLLVDNGNGRDAGDSVGFRGTRERTDPCGFSTDADRALGGGLGSCTSSSSFISWRPSNSVRRFDSRFPGRWMLKSRGWNLSSGG